MESCTTAPSTLYAATFARGVFSIQRVAVCFGDCDGDQQISVDEILSMVGIALGAADITVCPAGDANHDNEITVDEIIAAANHALNGCGGGPLSVASDPN